MTKTYNVLWIDDEFDTEDLKQVAIDAENHGIFLHGYRSFEEGFKYLEENLRQVDAVLLDARFFEKKAHVAGTENLKGLGLAWARLNQLDAQRVLPRFILSGQTRYQNDDTFAETYGRHYRKQSPTEVAQLWHDIKVAADASVLTQLRHRYADAFAACTAEHLGEAAGRWLLEILSFLHRPATGDTGELYFNPLRRLVEALFHAAHRRGLLADECVPDGKINLRWACLFMSGKPVSQEKGAARTVKSTGAVFPPRLAQTITQLLDVTNTLSHVEAEQKAAQNFLRQTEQYVHTPYLLAGLTYQLLDVLIWFRGYADAHPDVAVNRAAWVYPAPADADSRPPTAAPPAEASALDGRVFNISQKGFGYFLEDGKVGFDNTHYIPNQLVANHALTANERIRVSLGGSQPDGKPPKVVRIERL